MTDPNTRLLKAILRSLDSLKASLDKHGETIRGHDQSSKDKHDNDPLPLDLRAEYSFPIAIGEYYESEQRSRKSVWRKIKAGLEILGICAGVALAVLTYLTFFKIASQADAAHKQVSIMQKQLRLDQRAWIVVKYPTIPLNDGRPLAVPVSIENIGKTIAKRISGEISVYVISTGQDPDLNYGPGHTHYEFGPVGTFIPSTPDVMNWIAIRNGHQAILTPEIRRAILAGESLIVVHGRIEYWDIFGTQHWVTFCQETGGGAMRASASDKCAAYNVTDSN